MIEVVIALSCSCGGLCCCSHGGMWSRWCCSADASESIPVV